MNCPNCGTAIGCPCSGKAGKVTASNGTQVCTNCVNQYEQRIALLTLNSSNEAKKSK